MKVYILIVLSMVFCSTHREAPSEEVVRFTNGDITLEGVLHVPQRSGKVPLVIFVHGSGQVTRDANSEFVQPLLAEGYAVFRYDKRGVGASGGQYIDVGSANSIKAFPLLASDCVAAIDQLRKDSRIDPQKIIVGGGSQAGWIIPEVASQTKVWLTFCLSGPSVSVGEEIYYSDYAEHGTTSQDKADQLLRSYDGPRGFDPLPNLAKLKNPSLWIFGDKDISIPVQRCIFLFDSVKTAQKLPLEMKVYPGADHGIYTAGRREDYVTYTIEWIRKQ